MNSIKLKEKYIDIEKVIQSKNPTLFKWLPQFILNYIKRIIHQDELNDIMHRRGDLVGIDFAKASLEELETKVLVDGLENIPAEGGVILVANHPLGGLDGIAFMVAVSEVREDMLFLVNDILLSIENLSPLFLPVNKHGSNAREASRIIEEAYASDKAILVFPAGLVSRKVEGKIQDLDWKKSFVNKAKRYKKNIIPVHIKGRNSNWFYNLSRIRSKLGIKANLEMFYLADELFKQRGKNLNFKVGEPISYESLDSSKNAVEWADEIRTKVYNLDNI